MEIIELILKGIEITTIVIGSATAILWAIQPVVKLTETKRDDEFVRKAILTLEKAAAFLAWNKK